MLRICRVRTAERFLESLVFCRVRDRTTCFLMIFGCADLRIAESGAKFDSKPDIEIRFAVAPQKPGENCEKLICSVRKFRRFFVLASQNEMSGIV